MWDSFHGASLDAISVGGEAVFRRDMGPLVPGAEHVPPCDPRGCRFRCGGSCDASCADYVDYVLGREQDVAAVIVETVRCTDVQIPPPDYYRRLREACDRHGALLILDEVPIGLGRTGTMFAFERYGIVPDMVVLGKGLGGAVFPMAALIARRDLDVAGDRALGHYTHEKSSVGCAAALATLDVIEDEGLLARTRTLGGKAMARLRDLASRHPLVGDVRGVGLLLGVELVRPDGTPATREAERVMYGCLARGLSFKGADFTGRSDYGPFIAAGIPAGGLFTGAEGIKTAEEAALWGGTAGMAYDPCYHQACDTAANVNLEALATNADAVAYATLQFAMNTESINGQRGKGNFRRPASFEDPHRPLPH